MEIYYVHKYSLELQTMGNFEFDIDMKPGTWIYVSRFDEKIQKKLMIPFQIFISKLLEL